MSDSVRTFKLPAQVPTTWFIAAWAFVVTMIGAVFMFGVRVEHFESRLAAQELHSSDVDAEFQARTPILRSLGEKLDSLNARLSRIEGQNEMILRKIQ